VLPPPDPAAALATLRAVASPPTAPFHEQRVLRAIAGELDRRGIAWHADAHGQLFARLAQGTTRRALAFVAHTDHPAFDVVAASGMRGVAKVRGGLEERCFAEPVSVIVHHDDGAAPFAATLDRYEAEIEVPDWSPGFCRITAERPLRVGNWAVMDLPDLEIRGRELHLRAADDLAGVAVMLCALDLLRGADRPYDVHCVFTRAEESGLFGARLIAAEGSIPDDAYVVSLEASNARYAPAGAGPVVRVGDYHNTFSNAAEQYLRVAQERLLDRGLAVQRALLPGGTCEASAFVRLGWIATGVALPNVGYHNADTADRFVPEIIHRDDYLTAILLLAEAALAAGSDESESWWPDVQVVPPEISARLAPLPATTSDTDTGA
jgi:putative aminopeptidase FrvX